MTTMQRRLTGAAATAVLAAGCGLATAQDVEVSSGSVSAGAGYWTKDRPQLGIYDGMNEKGGYLLLDADYARRSDNGTWLQLDLRNLGLDTREFRADWLRQGNMGVFLEYSRIPRDNPYTFLTGVQGIGSSVLRVPTPSATTLSEIHLGTVRELTSVGFVKHLGGGSSFQVNLKNEDKSGTRQWGRGGAPEFAVEPIDSSTRQLEAFLAHTGKAFQVQGGYYGSWYTSDIKLVDTALTTGASQFFLSQPLDNQAHQLFLNGGYNFTERTRATFKVAYTRATQDETIPVGAGVATFAGAPTNLDGRVDTTLLQLGLSSRVGDAFSWLASLRNYDQDEKTPQRRVVQTNPACPTASSCVDTTPLDYETLSGKLEGTYRVARGLSLTGGIDQVNQERSVPVGTPGPAFDLQRFVPWRTEVDETTYRAQLRRSLSETVNGSIAYLHSKRDGSEYTPTNELESDQINPIHIADRDRDKVALTLDWSPRESLNLTFHAAHAQDDYAFTAARPYGLRDGEATTFSVDAAYSISDNWRLSAWYTRDNTKATQFGQRDTAPTAIKEAHLEDIGDTFGAGVTGTIMPKVKAGFDLLYSKNVNKYPETLTPNVYPAGAAGPLPEITNTLARLKLFAAYALNKNSEVRLDYIHERWKTDDWSWLFADGTTFTYGVTTDGTQVVQAPKQTADFIGVRFIHRFQ